MVMRILFPSRLKLGVIGIELLPCVFGPGCQPMLPQDAVNVAAPRLAQLGKLGRTKSLFSAHHLEIRPEHKLQSAMDFAAEVVFFGRDLDDRLNSLGGLQSCQGVDAFCPFVLSQGGN